MSHRTEISFFFKFFPFFLSFKQSQKLMKLNEPSGSVSAIPPATQCSPILVLAFFTSDRKLIANYAFKLT